MRRGAPRAPCRSRAGAAGRGRATRPAGRRCARGGCARAGPRWRRARRARRAAAEREAPAAHPADREEEVVADGEVAEQQRGLVGAPQAPADALVGRQVGDVLAEEEDAAGRGRKVPGDRVEERGLAGAVGAEDGAALARGHRERDASIARSAPNVRVTPSSTRASSERAGASRRRCRAIGQAGRSRAAMYACYGQAGLSRVPMPILSNSACERFSRWSTFSHAPDHLVVERAVGALGHFGDEVRADRLAVVVERDRAGRALQLQLGERLAVLGLAAGEVALHRVERVERGLHVDVVVDREQARRGKPSGKFFLYEATKAFHSGASYASAFGPAESVPSSDSRRLPLKLSTSWSR